MSAENEGPTPAFAVETRHAPQEGTGPVEVGWLLATPEAGVLYDAPTRLRTRAPRSHAKSAAGCPAVLNLESRLFEVPCPVDLALAFARSDFGAPAVVNAEGDLAGLRAAALDRLIAMSPEAEWRHPERPVLQLRLPYIFLADEPVYMAQLPAFGHLPEPPLPGLTIPGRFPIDIWPRTLTWAFEWHDPTRPLLVKRGTPLFYLQFETCPQNRPVQLVEAERTPELAEYLAGIEGVVNYVNQTFSLFKAAEARRPARLLSPKRR